MLFNSYIFIFVFLPMLFIGWYGLNHYKKYYLADVFLLAMSLWFYGYSSTIYLLFMMVSICVNYLLSWLLYCGTIKSNRVYVIIALAFNLGGLFYFKYYDFFINNINVIFKSDLALLEIALPLGISFYTFQQIGYQIDRTNGAEHYSFLDYANFISFFPQLVAGPIVSHDELVPQIKDYTRRVLNIDNFLDGLIVFIFGISKKVLLADWLAAAVDNGFNNITEMGCVSANIIAVCYCLQILLDFSGYCDMAIGIGKMLNIDLPLNFDSPYRSLSLREFWRRWHITLGRFFTKYVYIPLGGNRKGKRRTIINTLIVFFLSGFWHGANWTFIIWGVLHGIMVCLSKTTDKLPKFWRWVVTMLFVDLSGIVFRAPDVSSAVAYFKQLFYWDGLRRGVIQAAKWMYRSPVRIMGEITKNNLFWKEYYMIPIFLIIVFISAYVAMSENTLVRVSNAKLTKRYALYLAMIFAFSIISLSGVVVFIYSFF